MVHSILHTICLNENNLKLKRKNEYKTNTQECYAQLMRTNAYAKPVPSFCFSFFLN